MAARPFWAPLPFPYLWYFPLSHNLSFFSIYVFHVIVQVLDEFHFLFPVEGLFSMYLEACVPLKVARPLGSLLVQISVPSAGCIYT